MQASILNYLLKCPGVGHVLKKDNMPKEDMPCEGEGEKRHATGGKGANQRERRSHGV